MLALALISALWTVDSAPKPGTWRATLAAAKFPASLIEVTPRNNFAIVYGCDDAPFTLHLEGARVTTAFFDGSAAFQVLDFQAATGAQAYVMTMKSDVDPKAAPFRIQLHLRNPALGIWDISGDENLMFTGRKTFIDQTRSRTVKTVKPSPSDCSTTRGGE